MKVSVFGLGHIGSVSAACLAQSGHQIIGVDRDIRRVEALATGRSPVVEPHLAGLIAGGQRSGRLRATTDPAGAIQESEVSLLCVGTPPLADGRMDISQIMQVCRDIAPHLRLLDRYHTIVIRSTIVPGTSEDRLIPLLEESSGLSAGRDFGVCVNPEFLRVGTAVDDYRNPPYTLVGELSPGDGDPLHDLYHEIPAPFYQVSLRMAEMIKYASNAYHALKVAFANEIGVLSRSLGLDGVDVMGLLCADSKLNVSANYLRPGPPFGGSCLTKDLQALLHRGREAGMNLPLLEAILPSNEQHTARVLDLVRRSGQQRIALVGLTAKSGSGDPRGSVPLSLARQLLNAGYEVRAFDADLAWDMIGAPHADTYLDGQGPLIRSIARPSLEEVVRTAGAIVLTKPLPPSSRTLFFSLLRADQTLIELIWEPEDPTHRQQFRGTYFGIAW